MPLRYILRPDYINKTPRLLADALDIETRKWPGWTTARPDFRRDLFMIYPEARAVDNGGQTYATLRGFFSKHKAGQRQAIATMGLPAQPVYLSSREVPRNATGPFVIRPLTHMKGKDYRVVGTVRDVPADHYISPLYPKEREYRLLFMKGEMLLAWQKMPGDKASDQAWSNVEFARITDIDNSYLALHTDCFARLRANPIIRAAHIVGVDVMFARNNPQRWSVVEFNTCPSLTHSRQDRTTVCDFIGRNW